MITKKSSQLNQRSRGFTLVEIMVVITIMAILIGITTMVIGNVLNAGKEKQTRATIKKIDELVKDRLRAFRLAKDEGQFDGEVKRIYLNWDGPAFEKDLATVCVYKYYIGKYFGMNYLQNPSRYTGNSVSTDLQKKVFAPEILYELITKGTIAGENPVPRISMTAAELDFSSGEIADLDDDGRMEFVDGWGQPIRFYLWPTRLARPHDTDLALVDGNLFLRLLIPSAADRSNEMLSRDPDDPKGVLSRASTGDLGYLSGLDLFDDFDNPLFATDLPHHFDTYHSFLIISSGQDETLGLDEPIDNTLAAPIAGFDSFGAVETNSNEPEHVYNSVMNDDITNYQGPGGS